MPEVYDGVYIPRDPTDTQVEAAAAAAMGAASARDLVRRALQVAREDGLVGLTDTEIATVTGLYLNTAAPSRFALVKKGEVEDSGDRRLNERGRKMIVWGLVAQ